MTTLKDIAAKTGLSVATVSRVLNNTADEVGIAQKTQEEVRRVARELNYRPNKVARNLKLGREPGAILFLSCELSSDDKKGEGVFTHPFFSHMIHGIHLGVTRTGHYLAYMDASHVSETQLRSILEEAVVGVVTFGQLSDIVSRLLARKRVPTVCIEPYLPSFCGYAVYVDNRMAVQQAISHLYDLGHRRIGLLSVTQEPPSGSLLERVEVFKKEMDALGDVAWEVHLAPNDGGLTDVEAGYRAAYQLFTTRSRDLPTAIITTNDLCAIGVLKAAQKAGIRVPEDLSVVGIDDIDWSAYVDPPLTTVRIPKETMGMRAIEVLSRLLAGDSDCPVETRIPTSLIVRASTAPAGE